MNIILGIANIGDFICCTKGNGDGLVLNMENVKETNGNRYLKCYKIKPVSYPVVGRQNVEKYQRRRDMHYSIHGMYVFLVDTITTAFLARSPYFNYVIYLIRHLLLLVAYMTCYLVAP